jgi:hypothetical protein
MEGDSQAEQEDMGSRQEKAIYELRMRVKQCMLLIGSISGSHGAFF